jgi:hypothetical protein
MRVRVDSDTVYETLSTATVISRACSPLIA